MINELEGLVDTLNNLPINTTFTSSTSMESSRASILREICLSRMSEIAGSVYEELVKKRFLTVFIFTKAIMDTDALFLALLEEVKQSLINNDLSKVRDFLNIIFSDIKIEDDTKKISIILDVAQKLELISERLDKKITFSSDYDLIDDFTQPNLMFYGDEYITTYWCPEKDSLETVKGKVDVGMVLPSLVGSIKSFLFNYKALEKNLEKFEELYKKMR